MTTSPTPPEQTDEDGTSAVAPAPVSPPPRRRTSSADFRWTLASELALLVTALASVRLVTKHLTQLNYGRYTGIYGLVSIGVSICSSWPLLVVAQCIVRNREDPRAVAHSTFSYLMGLSTVGLVFITAVGAWRLSHVSVVLMLALGGAELFGSAVVGALAGLAQSTLGVPFAARCRMAGSFTRLAVLGVLTFSGRFTLLGIGVGYLAGFVVTSLGLAKWLSVHLGFFPRPGRRNPEHLRQSFAFMTASGANTWTEDGDKAVMGIAHHELDNANYGAAYRFALMGALPFTVMTQASHAEFVQAGDHHNEHLRRTIKYTLPALAYGVAFSIGVYFLGQPLLRLVIPKYSDATTTSILRWISLLLILRSGRNFSQNALLGLGRIRARLVINVVVAMVSFVMYFALIPHWSWKGAVFTTLVCEALMVVLSWAVLIHCQRLENAVIDRRDALARRAAAV